MEIDMVLDNTQTHIAYRCPDCGTVIYGFVGKFALMANLIRLKCECQGSALDIGISRDKKIRLSVPCLYCKQNHSYTVSQSIFFGRELFSLSCPHARMEIAHTGDKEAIDRAVSENEEQLRTLMKNLEIENISEMQPVDLDEQDVLPDATTYDVIRFLVKDLESDGNIHCPCKNGDYDLRFNETGIEVYCKRCGASYSFNVDSRAAAEEFLNIDSITLG